MRMGYMSGGDGNMRRLGGSKRCSDGFVVLSGVEQTVGRGERDGMAATGPMECVCNKWTSRTNV